MPKTGTVFVRSITTSLWLALAGCGADMTDMTLPGPGVPVSLAAARSETIRDLRYALSFDIPLGLSEPINGQITARFRLEDAPTRLVLDFAPATALPAGAGSEFVKSLKINGVDADFRHANGHVVLPGDGLVRGENTLEAVFRAGDASLNRNVEFLYSLFVPALAHTVFPVFDQPDLKARYILDLTIPSEWNALANGREISREPMGDRTRIRYSETEPLPTYLLAFAAGRFTVEEAERGGRMLRMFHRETDSEKVARNLDAVFDLHAAALDALEVYTGIPYPFEKFDFLLIPAFQFGGMEHPGSIYYRDSGILLDESATQEQRLSRASLIAHETAHMWFGDLVTMRWFNDVWMKEVFANFMAAKIVNPSFPEVNHDLLFLTENYPAAYAVDRTAGTHPIRQDLGNLNEAANLYGAIIYQKAPIVMRQLERIIGEEEFREGIRTYLNDFRFGNATWLDLIERLDERTPIDLGAWSRAWVEEPGRPTIRTDLQADADGRTSGLTLVQSDPVEGRGLRWTQQIEVVVGRDGILESFPIELEGERTPLDLGESIRPEFVLPSGGGLAYGEILLDEGSRAYLIEHFERLDDPLTRGAVWITLWEEMLDRRVGPTVLMDLALAALPVEDTEQVVQLMLGGVRELYWRYLSAAERGRLGARLEDTLRRGFEGAGSPSLKSAYFSAFYSIVTTGDGVRFLERVWRREVSIPGLALSEIDETTMAEQLAVRSHPDSGRILAEQLSRIGNADRRERLDFIMPSLSADPGERRDFFESLAERSNRGREPWVVDALGYLNHPLRAQDAVLEIRPGLELLEEIRETGDIFFPTNWARALLGGHNSAAAASQVTEFLEERSTGYPMHLRRIVLQAADPLFRSVAIQAAAGE